MKSEPVCDLMVPRPAGVAVAAVDATALPAINSLKPKRRRRGSVPQTPHPHFKADQHVALRPIRLLVAAFPF